MPTAHCPRLLSPSPLLPRGWVKDLQPASEGGLLHAASVSPLLCPLEPAPLPQRPSPLRGHHWGLRLLLPINCQEREQRSKYSLLTWTVPRGAGRQELRRKGLGEGGGHGDAGKSGKELVSAGIPRGGSTMTQGLGGVVLPSGGPRTQPSSHPSSHLTRAMSWKGFTLFGLHSWIVKREQDNMR